MTHIKWFWTEMDVNLTGWWRLTAARWQFQFILYIETHQEIMERCSKVGAFKHTASWNIHDSFRCSQRCVCLVTHEHTHLRRQHQLLTLQVPEPRRTFSGSTHLSTSFFTPKCSAKGFRIVCSEFVFMHSESGCMSVLLTVVIYVWILETEICFDLEI